MKKMLTATTTTTTTIIATKLITERDHYVSDYINISDINRQ